MTIGGTALSGAARVDAHLELGQKIPYTATATFQSLSLTRLVDLPEELGVVMTGTLFSQGDMTRSSSIMADARLDSTRLTWGDVSLQAMRPVRLQYASDTVRIDDLMLSGADTQLSAAGTLSANRGLNLIINGYGDLRPTGGVRSDLEWLRGRFDISSRVQGTFDAPRLSGDASLRNAALKLPGTGEILDAIEANVKLSGRTITLARANARLGGGEVTAGGRFLLPMQGESDVDLRANLTRVSVRPEPELHAVASGSLSLLGPFDDLLLHGRLEIESLRYSKNFALDRLIPRRNAPPIKVPALDAHQSVRLAVGLHAPGNVIVSNNVLDSELRADLTVTGTSERIGLIGSLTPLRATAHYRDNVFVVERAAIDFSEEFRIYTQFDLRATTEACDMKIAVDVHGNSDRYNVAPRGEDDNGAVDPDDVLTCLQFGVRQQEFRDQLSATEDTDSEESTSPLSNPVVPIGLDLAWTVSGMDEKVRRLLPIELDEVRLESGWSSHYRRTTTRVLVGKEISDRLQLRYSRSIDDIDDQNLSFEYQLSDIAALEGSWLSASNVSVGDLGLDLRLRWEFR
jgi:autotransporter translocation and assembly factor TamB